MVLLAELFVDWVKHAFITRFNEIPADIYREYTLTLAYDLIASKQKYVSGLTDPGGILRKCASCIFAYLGGPCGR